MGDTALKETVLKDQPKPNHKGLQALKLDPDMVDLLPRQAQHPARSIDTSFRRIQGRMLDTMGPLGKFWGKLEDIMTGWSKSACDVKKLMRLVEQSVLLLGQANVLTNHNRRLNILTRFLKESKTATQLLKQIEKPLMGNHEFLFGTSFYKALHKRAKGNSTVLGSNVSWGVSEDPSILDGAQGSQAVSNKRAVTISPFHQAPRSSRDGGGGGFINLTHQSPPQLINQSLIVTNTLTDVVVLRMEVIETNVLPSLKYLLLESRGFAPIRRAAKKIPQKLGKNHDRSHYPRNSEGIQNSVHSTTNTMASGTHPTVFSGRVHKPHTRGGGNADKVSNRRMQSFARPVCGSLISATQEERDFSPNVQFETSERICCLSTLQNGGGADAYVNDPDTRLDDDNRPQSCIFLRPCSRKTSQISPVSLERKLYQFKSLPFG